MQRSALGALGAPLSGQPGVAAFEGAAERLDLADAAAQMALGDAVVEAVQAMLAHEARDRGFERPEYLDRPAVAGSRGLEQLQRFVVQAAGVDDEDFDGRAGAGDGVDQHHVFGAEAGGERRAGVACADTVQAPEKLGFDRRERLWEGFHKRRTVGRSSGADNELLFMPIDDPVGRQARECSKLRP